MPSIKKVGKRGQISLGKSLTGLRFMLEKLPDGDFVLKRLAAAPMSERDLEPAVQAELVAAREWRKSNPAKATDLTELAREKDLLSEPLIPNEITVAAMREARAGNLKSRDSFGVLMADLHAKD